MREPIRIEIKSKSEFWQRAFHVEWQDQYPDRLLPRIGDQYLADDAWLEDLNRVAEQVFCEIVLAPANPNRREWIRTLTGRKRE